MISQLVAHLVGDFFLQSDWMALNKARSKLICLVHVLFYTVPFLFLTQSPVALAVICGTHWVIDHYGLGKRLAWLKNFLAPKYEVVAREVPKKDAAGNVIPLATETKYEKRPLWKSWDEVKDSFGYDPQRPAFISFWLMVAVDNGLHLLINLLALKHL